MSSEGMGPTKIREFANDECNGLCVFKKNPSPHHPCLGLPASPAYAGLQRRKSAVGDDVETLKRRLPLLDYLRQHNWTGHPAGRSELVGLCPLHEETQPSFYVNTRKDVFYCHGWGQGGDLSERDR
jgi:hypothetical protein